MEHAAVQQNDLESRIYIWKSMLPFYFYFTKTNYKPSGMFYVPQLNHLETLYPGLKPLLEEKGVSVPVHSFHHVRKLQVSYLMLGNLWKIETLELLAASVFHRFTLLWIVIFMD